VGWQEPRRAIESREIRRPRRVSGDPIAEYRDRRVRFVMKGGQVIRKTFRREEFEMNKKKYIFIFAAIYWAIAFSVADEKRLARCRGK